MSDKKLSQQQRAALIGLKRAGMHGGIRNGQGYYLTTVQSLAQRGLATVYYWPNGKPGWQAFVTREGLDYNRRDKTGQLV